MSVLYLKNNQGIWEEISTINGHSPVITASKSNGITTISVDGTAIATITDGNDGSDYVLTAQDKNDIAAIVIQTLPTAQGVSF